MVAHTVFPENLHCLSGRPADLGSRFHDAVLLPSHLGHGTDDAGVGTYHRAHLPPLPPARSLAGAGSACPIGTHGNAGADGLLDLLHEVAGLSVGSYVRHTAGPVAGHALPPHSQSLGAPDLYGCGGHRGLSPDGGLELSGIGLAGGRLRTEEGRGKECFPSHPCPRDYGLCALHHGAAVLWTGEGCPRDSIHRRHALFPVQQDKLSRIPLGLLRHRSGFPAVCHSAFLPLPGPFRAEKFPHVPKGKHRRRHRRPAPHRPVCIRCVEAVGKGYELP